MSKILWLDDESESVSYEQEIEIPDRYGDVEIFGYEKINELLEYIVSENSIHHEDIFIIDIMLIQEQGFIKPDGKHVGIENYLMAGTIFYREYLKDAFPLNPIILYTSREHEQNIFQSILEDERYDKNLFLVEKSKKDTQFFTLLDKLLKDKR